MAKRNPFSGKPDGGGKGILQQAVHEAGMSRRQSKLIVDAVVNCWKEALARHEEVELPIGVLHVVSRKTRRAFESGGLKGTKRRLFDINKRPTVQLVKKKLGELNPPSLEMPEPIMRPAPPARSKEAVAVKDEVRATRSARIGYLDRYDLLKRFL